MNNQKEQILKALTEKHVELIKTDKLNSVRGGIGSCIANDPI